MDPIATDPIAIDATILALEADIERLCTTLEGLDAAGLARGALPDRLTDELARAIVELARRRPDLPPHPVH